ncbi:MAG TPA: MBOAT family O-acyltransferase [Hanamia sp.]
MSYTIEVYRGKQKAEKHFGIYALYVMFYPQLVAGPIERPQNLLHQFWERHYIEYSRIVNGLKLMLFGLFKKVVIADRLALYVNSVYNHAEYHTGLTLLIATIFFAFQIYCDFSAYSDIAIGAAKVMGFNLMTNFNRPYFSKNISEFWKRWHISLSSWFADYLYIPLGGNRVTIPRWFFNLFIVFLISGVWHGANWTFIIWGVINGLYLISAIIFNKKRERFYKFIGINEHSVLFRFYQIATTFILTSFAWIFFRANNLDNAFTIIKRISKFDEPIWSESPSLMIYSLMGIFLLLSIEYIKEYKKVVPYISNPIFKYSVYVFLVLCILLFGVFDGGQFIYFQF